MKPKIALFLVLIILFLINICCFPTEPKEKKAKFEITSMKKLMKDYGSPYILTIVKNTGNATGYNVSCTFQAFKNNIIIGTAHAFFAGLDNISPGQSAQDDAIFFDLSFHSDYDNLTHEISWLTR